MWYYIYLAIGVGINFVIHDTKPYPGKSIFWGYLLGLGIPLLTMVVLSYIHQKILSL